MKQELISVVDKCIVLFRDTRMAMADAIVALYEVWDKELWKDKSESFSEFCEDHLKMSQSQASKMIAVYKRYCVESTFAANIVANISMENLYLATKLEGTPKQQLEKARLLKRTELTAQKVYEQTGSECNHEHTMCVKCHARVS